MLSIEPSALCSIFTSLGVSFSFVRFSSRSGAFLDGVFIRGLKSLHVRAGDEHLIHVDRLCEVFRGILRLQLTFQNCVAYRSFANRSR